MKCEECGSENVHPAAVPGLVACPNCGRVGPASVEEIAELEPDPGALRIENQGEVFRVPDGIEVEVGWRAWGVKHKTPPGRVPLLESINHGQFWTPGQPMEAVCDRRGGRSPEIRAKNQEEHIVPMKSCKCGLYTARTYEHLMSLGNEYHRYDEERTGMFHLVGKVMLWGKVIPATQGWRSSLGYPKELYLPFEAWELAESLAETYGVDVQLKNILDKKGEVPA